MKKKFLSLLTEKCKDMGLTSKALDELTEMGSEGLADDASDEDIQKKVDSLVPFAKAMQAEITRKTRKDTSTQSKKQSTDKKGEGDEGDGDNEPDWFKNAMKKRDEEFEALKRENESLKAEGAKKSRSEQIAAKAKELGIPDFLMKRFSMADDADIEKELTEYKQDLVTNKLMPQDAAHEMSGSEEAMRSEAKAWAEGLPNK